MSEVDKDLSDRYRAVPGDGPPAHVDAAILAAAKRAVGSQPQATWTPRAVRRWYVPVSLAAVLVLSVVVTLQVERERPDIAMPDAVPVERKDQELRLQTPTAPPSAPPSAPRAKTETGSAATPPARKETAQDEAPVTDKKKAHVSAAPAARQVAPAPAFVPDPKPAASAEAKPATEPADALRGRAAAGQIANEKLAETTAVPPSPARPAPAQNAMIAAKPAARPAPESDVGGAGARSEARASSAPPPPPAPAAARADLAKRDLAPAEWLEQIAQLRMQQRDREADEQFAEFRRRYPDYRIPEAMTERIAPRK